MKDAQEMSHEFDGIAYRKWIEHENRKAWWRGRLATQLARDLCCHCFQKRYCGRLRVNDRIIVDVLVGRGCPDYCGVWSRVFDKPQH